MQYSELNIFIFGAYVSQAREECKEFDLKVNSKGFFPFISVCTVFAGLNAYFSHRSIRN